MLTLQEHADAAMIEFDGIVARYHYGVLELQANPKLLAHANESFIPAKVSESGELNVEEYLELIRDGKGRSEAARLLDAEPRDVKKRLQFDQSFREFVELAEEEASEKIEALLWNMANMGERWAMELWLKKRNKNRWGEDATVVRHEGTVMQELSAAPLVDQILAMQALLEGRRQNELTTGQDRNIIDVDVVDNED